MGVGLPEWKIRIKNGRAENSEHNVGINLIYLVNNGEFGATAVANVKT